MAATRLPGWLRLWLGRDKPGEGREAFRAALARRIGAVVALHRGDVDAPLRARGGAVRARLRRHALLEAPGEAMLVDGLPIVRTLDGAVRVEAAELDGDPVEPGDWFDVFA